MADALTNPRDETLVDAIATLVQAGHRDQKTSHAVALEIAQLCFAAPGETIVA